MPERDAVVGFPHPIPPPGAAPGLGLRGRGATIRMRNCWKGDCRCMPGHVRRNLLIIHGLFCNDVPHIVRRFRSEKHTSELQSLMRISYAVFCLKKKKKKNTIKKHKTYY